MGFIVLDDPPVHIMGHGACTPTISMALDLSIELGVFLLELESCFLELLVPGLQLLHPKAGWSPYIPLDLVVEVVCQGSLLLMDAFDVSLGGTYHKTFMRGVMAPLLESELEGDFDSPMRRSWKDSTMCSITPMNSSLAGMESGVAPLGGQRSLRRCRD